jgi:ribosomal protein RSM22 (predicted rRNA methylase)
VAEGKNPNKLSTVQFLKLLFPSPQVLIEPATPGGFENIRQARNMILASSRRVQEYEAAKAKRQEFDALPPRHQQRIRSEGLEPPVVQERSNSVEIDHGLPLGSHVVAPVRRVFLCSIFWGLFSVAES